METETINVFKADLPLKRCWVANNNIQYIIVVDVMISEIDSEHP